MQILIDTVQCPCRTLNDECGISGHECYTDDICSSCPLIRNGGVKLPKGHGRLIDADKIQFENTEYDTYGDYCRAFDAIDQADTIIDADKEGD